MNSNSNLINFKRKTGIIKFYYFYKLKIFYKYLIVIVLGLMFGLAIALLQKNTGIYSVGLSGITQGFARLSSTIMSLQNFDTAIIDLVFNLVFWGLYLLLNIPLLIFAYLKIGKHFALLSITYLTAVNLFGFLLGFIPNINSIFIFGNTNPEDLNLLKNNVVILDWMEPNDLIKTISLFFYVLVYIPITGLILAILYILGGSTGGADPISMYVSILKQESLGNIIIVINMFGLIMANLIGSFIPGYLVDQNYGFSRFFSPNMLCSIFYVLGSGFLINYWFPKNKPINISIYTKKTFKVKKAVESTSYRFSIFKIDNQLQANKFEIICTYIQFLNVYQKIRLVDQNALIFTDIIKDLDGQIKIENYTKQKL